MAASSDAAASSSSNEKIKIKVKTLGQASYDLEVAPNVSVLACLSQWVSCSRLGGKDPVHRLIHHLTACDKRPRRIQKALASASP
jgi:hypothetical protein